MIDIAKLTNEDKGRIVRITSGPGSERVYGVLASWGEKGLFIECILTHPNYCTYVDPHCAELTDGRAVVAHQYVQAIRLIKDHKVECFHEDGVDWEYEGKVWRVVG